MFSINLAPYRCYKILRNLCGNLFLANIILLALTSVILRDGVVSLLGEGNVAKMKNPSHNVEDVRLCVWSDVHDLHCMLEGGWEGRRDGEDLYYVIMM